jgi:hypothetical protein
MAVTLPVIVLIYEALRCPRLRDWKQFIRSNWRSAAPCLIAGMLTLPYIYGKTQGSNALARVTGYTPDYSWHTFTNSNARFISELFYLPPNHLTQGMLLVLWTAIFVYAFSRRDRMLELMAFWVLITPVPIAFIAARGGACLYLPLFGWAMIFAKLASDLITLSSNFSTFPNQGAGDGATTGAILGSAATHRARWKIIAAAGRAAVCKKSLSIFRVFATVLMATGLALFIQWENQRFGIIHAWLNVGEKTLHVIQAFRSLNFHPSPGGMILLKPEKRFYPHPYYPVFVASLVWNDHSLRIYVDRQNQLTEQQIAKMDYVISLNEFQAKLLRGPESDHP